MSDISKDLNKLKRCIYLHVYCFHFPCIVYFSVYLKLSVPSICTVLILNSLSKVQGLMTSQCKLSAASDCASLTAISTLVLLPAASW